MTNKIELSPMHIAALSYAKRGIPVFPLVRNRDFRVPLAGEATTDLDQINTWWSKTPDYNIGIPAGAKSGIIVLNFITPEAWALALEKGLPTTPMVNKAKGCYVYCRHLDGIENMFNRQDYEGIILLGEGSDVIVPPSVVGNGPPSPLQKADIFSWVDGKDLRDLELGDVPEWLLKSTQEDEALVDMTTVIAQDIITVADIKIPNTVTEDAQFEVLTFFETNKEITPSGTEVLVALDSKKEKCSEPLPLIVDDWKTPVLFDGVSVKEVNAVLLPSWLGEYAGAVSRSTQTPEGMAVMLGLSAVAACVQKKFEVCPYGDGDHIETLSLWTVTILPSSERKSPILRAMTAPIYAWEKEQAKLLKATIEETSIRIQIARKRIEKLSKLAAGEADFEARHKLVQEISELQARMPAEVRAPKLWVGDTTAESLQDLLAENDERMAVLSDEGGIFEIMAGLYSDGKVNIDIYLQAYAGMPVRVKRKMRDVDLERPALTLGLTVQPVVIEGFANGSKKQFRGKGALGRFLFCIPESMLGRRVIGQRIPVTEEVKARYEEGIKALLAVPQSVDGEGVEIPHLLELDGEAIVLWEDFSRRVECMLGLNGELSTMGDWGGKLPGTALRIAGLMHLVEFGPDCFVIGKDTLNRAVELCDLLLGHTKAAFNMIGTVEAVSNAKKLFLWMQSQGFKVFTRTDCYGEFKWLNKEKLDKALSDLEERNIIKELMVPTKGKDAANYISNPSLMLTVGS